jgi:hypothetical protein
MSRRTSRNNSYSGLGINPRGIYRATVVSINGSLINIKIPRLGLDNIYENVTVVGSPPSVSDDVFVGFIEGNTGNPVAFTGTTPSAGDIESVIAGTALSGGGTSGDVTLNFAPSELSSATVSTSDKIVIADADDSDNPKTVTVQSIVDLSPVGDVTGVTAGTALSGGGTSGNVTVNFAPSELSSVTVATDDKVVIADTSDSDNPKHVTAQSIANLASASPGGSTSQIQYNNSGSFAGSANFTFDGTSTVTLTDTDAGSAAAPILELYRNSASAADADYIGQIKFQAENDNDQKVVYAKISGKIDDASDTTEDGIIEIMLQKAGSNNIAMRFNSTTMKLLNGTGIEVNGAAQFDSTVDIDGNTTITNSTGNYALIGGNANEQIKLVSDNDSGRPYLSFHNQDASGNLERKGYIGYPHAASDSSDIFIQADQGTIIMSATQMTSLNIDSITISTIQSGSESFADNDTSVMTSAAVQDKILSYGYTTNTGDITGVTAGTNLSGGGSSGAVTVNMSDPITLNEGIIKHLRSSDGTLYLGNSSGWELRLTSSELTPYVNAGLGLGNSSYYFAGLYSSTWLRTSGSTGWYSQTYGGGWYMTDTTWVRAYNGKSILTTGDIYLGAMQTFTGSGYATARRQDSSGILKEFVSSERFKTDLADLPLSEAEKVLNCRPILFRDKEEQAADSNSPIYAGLSAESLQTAGYEYPLKYDVDEDGGQTTTPRGIHYEHLVAPLITIIKDLKERVIALEG